mgnify:CR=1 FL=1
MHEHPIVVLQFCLTAQGTRPWESTSVNMAAMLSTTTIGTHPKDLLKHVTTFMRLSGCTGIGSPLRRPPVTIWVWMDAACMMLAPALRSRTSIPIQDEDVVSTHDPILSAAGFPRIGNQRQLKFAMESYFKGDSGEAELLAVAHKVQSDAWALQKAAGIAVIGLDGTLYDQVLDTITWLGAIPPRFKASDGRLSRATYTRLLRVPASTCTGRQNKQPISFAPL